MASKAKAVREALGGARAVKRRVQSPRDWLRVVRDGIPARAVSSVMEKYLISREEMIHQLGISESTFRRRQSAGRLSPVESDRLYRIADVAARAEEVLGGEPKAVTWLHAANRALEGETPLRMLDTEVGYQRVKDVLGRIDQGVYS